MSDARLSRRQLLQAGAVFAGMSAAVAQSAKDLDGGGGELLPAGGGGGGVLGGGGGASTASILTVSAGAIYRLTSGDIEQYERADIDGTLDVDGTLKLTG